MSDINADPFKPHKSDRETFKLDPIRSPSDFKMAFGGLFNELVPKSEEIIAEHRTQRMEHYVEKQRTRDIGHTVAVGSEWWLDDDLGGGKTARLHEIRPDDRGSESLPLPIAA